MNTKIYWLHAITPTHVGTGTGAGFVDLPIMREKTTGWPLIPGSAIKGVRRDHFERQETSDRDSLIGLAFGQPDKSYEDAGANSGAIVFTDARLLCLPVPSYYGTFAWVTSAMALRRAKRDAMLAGIAGFGALPNIADPKDKALVPSSNGPTRSELIAGNEARAYVSDLDLNVQASADVERWAAAIAGAVFEGAWQTEFTRRLLVVPDNTFNFLCQSGCEVQARVHIDDDKKTVKTGQLWYEEALPAESILFGLVWCDRIFGKQSADKQVPVTPATVMDRLCSGELTLQVGGKATVGRGRMRCVFGK